MQACELAMSLVVNRVLEIYRNLFLHVPTL